MEFKSKKLIQELNANARNNDYADVKPAKKKKAESNKKKWTISGFIIGIAVGIPLGLLVEFWRLRISLPWDDFFIGIVVFFITLVLCTAAGYFYGYLLDGSRR